MYIVLCSEGSQFTSQVSPVGRTTRPGRVIHGLLLVDRICVSAVDSQEHEGAVSTLSECSSATCAVAAVLYCSRWAS